jgi:hypothetical protein
VSRYRLCGKLNNVTARKRGSNSRQTTTPYEQKFHDPRILTCRVGFSLREALASLFRTTAAPPAALMHLIVHALSNNKTPAITKGCAGEK